MLGKKSHTTLLVMLLMMALCVNTHAQSPSTQGKSFWVTFMKNYQNKTHTGNPNHQLSLMISAKRACSGTISNPNTGWTVPFSVSASGLVKISMPHSECYNDTTDIVEKKGLYIVSTDTISLFAANLDVRSFDIANVLPVTALADEYIIQMYSSSHNGSEFVVIADEDNTEVEITPTVATKGGKPANVTFTVNLDRGETYQLITESTTGDFSGTLVKSRNCNKIAVFNGNVLTLIPNSYEAGDHTVEQAVPVIYWGKEFAVTSTELRSRDRIRITASTNNTQIKQNGILIATINARQHHEIELTAAQGSCFIETSEPSAVYLYLVGNTYGGGMEGDPSMLWISPTEQKIREITFGTYETTEIRTHFVNIVVPTSDKNLVTIDGINIGSSFVPLGGNLDLSFVRRLIGHGSHTIKSNKGVIAHVYGLGYRESYAYSVGSAMEDLQRTMWIEDEMYSADLFVSKYFCFNNPIKINLQLSYPYQTVLWDFGDGQTQFGLDTAVYHQYSAAGTYQIKAIVERVNIDECSGQMYDTVTARVKITDYIPTTNIFDTVCYGSVYSNYGHMLNVFADTTVVDTIPTNVCDSLVYIHLSIYSLHNDTVEADICLGDSYTANGFNITPATVGIFTETLHLTTQNGCDSIVTLKLTVISEYATTIRDTICLGESYIDNNFDVKPVSAGSATYTQNLVSAGSCDSTVTLYLTVKPAFNDTLTVLICANDSANMALIGRDITIFDTTLLGCDSIATTLYVLCPVYGDTLPVQQICIGNTYNRNGFDITPTDTGIVYQTEHFLTTKGCDSIVTLVLDVLPLHFDTVYDTVCAEAPGTNYSEYGLDTLLTSEGEIMHTQILTDANGCDSSITVMLTVFWVEDSTRYVLPGEIPGIITDTVLYYTTEDGCDAAIDIIMDFDEDGDGNGDNGGSDGGGGGGNGGYYCDTCCYNAVVRARICLGEHYNEYNFDTVPAKPGLVVSHQFLLDTAGCDSIVTLMLRVLPVYEDTVTVKVCSPDTSIEQGTLTYTADTLQTVAGCDSIIITGAIHCISYNDTTSAEICLGERYSDVNFDTVPPAAGIYTFTHSDTTAYGCDSITVLQLTVKPSYLVTVVPPVICLGERYTGYGIDTMPETAGFYTFIYNDTTVFGCDSIITVNLTVNAAYHSVVDVIICSPDTSIASGTLLSTDTASYLTALGCDSIIITRTYHYHTYNDTIDAAICLGERYSDYNFSVMPDSAGYYTFVQNNKTAKNCDSITVLNLTVNQPYNTVITPPALCLGERYSDYGFDTVFQAAGNYTLVHSDTTVNGCDSITTVQLTVYPAYMDIIITDTICSGERYDKYDFDVVPMLPDTVYEYKRLLTTAGGCDSIVTLSLATLRTYHDSVEIVICVDENQLQRNPFMRDKKEGSSSRSGDEFVLRNYSFNQVYTATNGCDSIVTLLYNFYPSYYDTVRAEICLGERYSNCNFDTVPQAAGLVIYSQNMKTLKGCDSITTLILTVNPVYDIIIEDAVCLGSRYSEYNFDTVSNSAGLITCEQHLVTAKGCDSIVTLQLTVNPTYYDTIHATVCLGETYGQYNFNVTPMQPGTSFYIQSLQTENMCDSTVTLQLTVNPTYYDTISAAVCTGETYAQYNFNVTPAVAGITYHVQHLQTENMCDSTITLRLTSNHVYNDTIHATVCFGETYAQYNFNITPEQTGIANYVQKLHTASMCDSIVTLQLTVNPSYHDTLYAAICLNDRYSEHGFDVQPDDTGVFEYVRRMSTVKNCDSTLTLILTVNPTYHILLTDTIYEDEFAYIGNNPFNAPGRHTVEYRTAFGCDSIVNLDLYVINYPDEITAFTPNDDGINDYFMAGFKVQIFNRYGALIYETHTREEQELGWNGINSKGYKVEPGMYFYILYNSKGKPRLKSTVEVLKK